MGTTWRVIGWTAPAVLVLALVAGRTWAEDAPPGKPCMSAAEAIRALAEAGQPGPEHKKLQPLVGNWKFTLRMWTDPAQSPAEMKGAVERKWVMGNRFVQESMKCEFDGKPFEGVGFWGYDAGRKKFTSVRACELCGTTQSVLGDWDAGGSKFVCSTEACCPLSGEVVKGRDEIVIESSDKIVMNVYKSIDGQDLKMMEIVCTRSK